MANLLSMPSMTVGLMGRRPGANNNILLQQLLAQSQAAQYDAGDDYFANPQSRPAGNGVPVLENGAVSYVPPTQGAAPAQRDRVSGWRVLDRVLGGDTITGGLDSERARLQAQADAPQQRARIEAALGGITDPRERALFLGLGGEDWLKATGARFTPQVVGAGAAQGINGERTFEQPTYTESGDTTLARTSQGVAPVFTRIAPSIAEQNVAERNRIDAIGAGQATIGNDRIDANGNIVYRGPDIASLGEGQKRVIDGVVTAENAKPNPATDPATIQARAAALEGTAGNIGIALERSRALSGNAGTWNQYNPLARQARIDLDNNLNTIKANLTFDKLNELKSQSPTGASGLGALSNQEGILLASTVAALSLDMSQEELERSFKLIDSLVEKMNQSAKGLRSSGANTPAPPPGFVLD